MKFPKENKIMFFQDFTFYTGVPSGVNFKCEIINRDTLQLTAPEYGGKPYGNGFLLIRLSKSNTNLKDHFVLLDLVKIAFKCEALKKEDPSWCLAAQVILDKINEES